MWLYYKSYIEGSVGTFLFFHFDSASCSLLQGRVHARTGYEGPQGEWRYSSTLALTLTLDRGGRSSPHPGRFAPGKGPGTHCTGDWVGPRATLDSCGKISPFGI